MRLRSLLAGSIAFLIALPVYAGSKEFAVTLDYAPGRYAAQCPNEAFFRGEIARRLGYDLFTAAAPKHLTVTVSFHQSKYQVVGEMQDDTGKVVLSETFNEPTCEAVIMDEVNSMVAEFIRPPAPCPVCPACAPVSEAPACPPATPVPVPAPALPAPPSLPVAEPLRPQIGFASVFSIGVAPVVVGGVSGFLGLRRENILATVEARALFAPSATIENIPLTTGYRYLVASIAGSGCYQAGWALSCARAELGSLAISNSSVHVTPSHIYAFSVGLRFGGEWMLMPGVALRAYGEFSFRPMNGVLREEDTRAIVWPGSLLSGTIGIGPVFFLPTQ